jgi:hypothetical protein
MTTENNDMYKIFYDNAEQYWSEKYNTFLNFLYYNAVSSTKVQELESIITKLKSEVSSFKDKYEKISKKYDRLMNDYEELNGEKVELELKLNPPKNNKKKRTFSDIEIDAYLDLKEKQSGKTKKRRRISKVSQNEIEKELIDIFEKINTIQDIIALELIESDLKYKYFKYDKFKKLYDTIPSLKKLDEMVGMNDVKNQILTQIMYFIQNLHNNDEMLHTVITGPPGVGKTELGKILGQVYLNIGLLENDKFKVVKRQDLIGKYVGHTAPRTQAVIDECKGGVMFIDEAYSLGHEEKRDSFSKEALDVINQNLTENKGKFVCIIAGYANEIDKCFFAQNDGLKRRFPFRYNIDKYTGVELCEIFKRKVKADKWEVEIESDKLNEFFNKHLTDNKFKYFGGDIEKLYQYTKMAFSNRVAKSRAIIKHNERKINFEDLENGMKNFIINQPRLDKMEEDDNKAVSKLMMYM